MAGKRGILFTGSIGLDSEDDVFQALADRIGDRAKRYPDGETGSRGYWIRWLNETIGKHPQLQMAESSKKLQGFKDNVERPFYVLADGVAPGDLDLGRFGYAKHSIESYEKFKALKDATIIPAGTRFQVSMPSSVAVLSGFIEMEARADVEAGVEKAFAGEVTDLVAVIPADELSIQWDVCYEVVGHDGGPPLHYDNIVDATAERVARHLGFVPDGVEAGIHICYGDPGHQHIVEPADLGTSVAFANAITAASPRPIEWMHMPVPRGRSDDAYFAPLSDLKLQPETELYLGLVHHTDGVDGTQARIAAAEKIAPAFGIATECGFGRRPANTIPALLDIHAAVADAS